MSCTGVAFIRRWNNQNLITTSIHFLLFLGEGRPDEAVASGYGDKARCARGGKKGAWKEGWVKCEGHEMLGCGNQGWDIMLFAIWSCCTL